jgi:hypothetical protein
VRFLFATSGQNRFNVAEYLFHDLPANLLKMRSESLGDGPLDATADLIQIGHGLQEQKFSAGL